MTYAPLPSFDELKQEFGENRVSVLLGGRAWELHSSCIGMDRTPGERTFYVHDVGRDWEWEEQIAWGLQQRATIAPKGYRPATHYEGHEFSMAYPELNYVTLGSSTTIDNQRYVTNVWSKDGERGLGSLWVGDTFSARARVLFVVIE